MLAAPSVRAFQVRTASRKVPLAALVFPRPDVRSPSHCAVARLFMRPPLASALEVVAGARERNVGRTSPHGSWDSRSPHGASIAALAPIVLVASALGRVSPGVADRDRLGRERRADRASGSVEGARRADAHR